jgi:hypothetical protein
MTDAGFSSESKVADVLVSGSHPMKFRATEMPMATATPVEPPTPTAAATATIVAWILEVSEALSETAPATSVLFCPYAFVFPRITLTARAPPPAAAKPVLLPAPTESEAAIAVAVIDAAFVALTEMLPLIGLALVSTPARNASTTSLMTFFAMLRPIARLNPGLPMAADTAAPTASTSIPAEAPAVTETFPAATALPSIFARTTLPRFASVPIRLIATAAPTAADTPVLCGVTETLTATPIAFATMLTPPPARAGIDAETVTLPPVERTDDELRTSASTMLSIALPEPVPAPANATPNLPPPPVAICAASVPARVRTWIVGVDVAETLMFPEAVSEESSTIAWTSFAMLLTAAVTPIAPVSWVLLPFPPLTMLIAIATPPASATIVEASVAVTRAAPASALTSLEPRSIEASIVFAMLFPEPAPVPAPEPAAPAIVSASMTAVEIASTTRPSTGPPGCVGNAPRASTVEFSIVAETVLSMSLSAIERPTATLVKLPELLRAIETAKAPASATIVEPSVAETLTPPPALIPIPSVTLASLIRASTVFRIVLPEPAPAPAREMVDPAELLLEPAASAPAKVSASTLGVEVAITVTSPAASAVEVSIAARAVLVISLMAKATPNVAVTLLEPEAFASAIAMPPASAVMSESSTAESAIDPAVALIVLPLRTIASAVLSRRFTDPAAAPASATEARCLVVVPGGGGPPPPAPPPDMPELTATAPAIASE